MKIRHRIIILISVFFIGLCIFGFNSITNNNYRDCYLKDDVMPLFNCKDTLYDVYGMCAHLTSQGDWPIRDEELEMMHSIGISNVRYDLAWNYILGKNGNFSYEYLDSVLQSVKHYNIRSVGILGQLDSLRAWNNPSDYKRKLDFLLNKSKGIINYWEFINEVNGIKDSNIEDLYLNSLSWVYPIIKKKAPNNVVVFSGLSSLSSNSFLEQIGLTKSYEYFDVMNFHSYSEPEKLVDDLRLLKRSMEKYGWSKPVWLTECGMHTACDDKDNSFFYMQVLPQALDRLGISKGSYVGVIRDDKSGYWSISEAEIIMYLRKSFSQIYYYSLAQIDKINPKKIPVLVAQRGESFPFEYLDGLIEYVKNGGTLIFPEKCPLYYDYHNKGIKRQVGDKYYSKLHISAVFPWSVEGRIKKISSRIQNMRFSSGFNGKISTKLYFNSPLRYMTDKNLKKGDQFVPILVCNNGNDSGCIAGIYILNSDLKGNIIFSTLMNTHPVNTEEEQAKWVARYYLLALSFGVEKVFWYNFRARETDTVDPEANFGILHKNLEPKPAYYAYKTLTEMLPERSTRPHLMINDNLYECSWVKPNGKLVLAVWCPAGEKKFRLHNNEKYTCFDNMGKIIKYDGIVGTNVHYFVEQ